MKIIREIINFSIFVASILVSIYLLDRLFIPKWLTNDDNSHSFITRGFYAEKENSLDVIFMGNSETYRGISPIILWDEYNITAYNYVSSGQRMWTGYYMFEEALKTQKPKVIFFNVDGLFSDNQSSMANYQKVFDNMKFSTNKLKAINDPAFDFSKKDKIALIFPIISYHSRYNELTLNDFKYALSDYHNVNKGLDMTTSRVAYNGNYIYDSEERTPLNPKVLKYLDKMVKRCKEENIILEFFWIPSPDSWAKEKTNTISDYAKLNHIPYNDLNLNYEEIGLNFENDSSDGGDHLNVYGAEKVAHYIGKYINDKYTFDEHSNEVVNMWNNDLKMYNMLKEKLEYYEN